MSGKALVVDDSTTMRQMISFTLADAGFDVVEGSDGRDALDQLDVDTDNPVQIIITDLNMPVMDGLTFIREVRAREEHRFTPILMLTTESQESCKQEGKQAGATGWLVKPFDPGRLMAAVSRVLP